MTPDQRFKWSLNLNHLWDWWVVCPACGFPMSVDWDEYCDFCAFLPSDGYNSERDPSLASARCNVEEFGMADPIVDEENEDWWRWRVEMHMAPEMRVRKQAFRKQFARLVAGFQRGELDEAALAAEMKRARNRFLGVPEGEEGPEPWEREYRRTRGERY